MTRGRARLVSAALCLGYAAALFAFTGGYAIDDTWIHLQFARNIAAGLGPRFMADSPPVYACSSPAWVWLLAVPYYAGLGGIASARALSALFSGLAVWLLREALAGQGMAQRWSFAGAALLAVNPWMIRWGSSGMEAAASTATVCAILLVLSGTGRRGFLAGALCGAAFLVRPELGIAGPVCAVALSLEKARGGMRRSLETLAVWGAAVAAWELFALEVFGRLTPTAVAAKALASGFTGYLPSAVAEAAKSLTVSDAGMLIVILAALLPPGRSRSRLPAGAASAFSWMLTLGLPVLLLAGRAPIVSRYLLPASPCIVFLGVTLLPRLRSVAGIPAPGIAVPVSAAASLAFGLFLVFPHIRTEDRNLQRYMDIAHFMRDSLPEGSIVAVREIGIFGYYGGQDLLDLGGLVSPQATPESFPGLDRDAMASLAFLRSQGVGYYLDPHGLVAPLMSASDRTGVRFVPLGEWVFKGGTAMTGRGTYARVLYRLEWLR